MHHGDGAVVPASPTPQGSQSARGDLSAVLAALERIERRLDRAESLAASAVSEAKHAVAMMTDTADIAIARLEEQGLDPDARLRNVVRLAERLSSDEAAAAIEATLAHVEALRAVLDSGILDPRAVAILSQAGRALAEAAADPVEGIGPFGLVRAIGEPDVRSATGLVVRFARRLGRSLGPNGAQELSADAESGRNAR